MPEQLSNHGISLKMGITSTEEANTAPDQSTFILQGLPLRPPVAIALQSHRRAHSKPYITIKPIKQQMEAFPYPQARLGSRPEQAINNHVPHRRNISEPLTNRPMLSRRVSADPQHTATSNSVNSERAPLLSRSASVDNAHMASEIGATGFYGTLQPVADAGSAPGETGGLGNSTSNTGPKIIVHCIRHAKAYHNLPIPGASKEVSRAAVRALHDPSITPHGHTQCARLAMSLPFSPSNITHILSSPSRRCIQTARLSVGDLVSSASCSSKARKLPIVLWNDLKELGRIPCNNGSKIEVLKEEFKDLDLVCDYLDEGWEEVNLHDRQLTAVDIAMKLRIDIRNLATTALEHNHVNAHGNIEIMIFSHGGLLGILAGHDIPQCNMWRNAQHMEFSMPMPDPSPSLPQDYFQAMLPEPNPMPEFVIKSVTTTPRIRCFNCPSVAKLRESGWKEEELALLPTETEPMDLKTENMHGSKLVGKLWSLYHGFMSMLNDAREGRRESQPQVTVM
ncbi:hypothetical protein VTL71DRAFT_12113 [Oculimacula yallundae]|uniref:Uncharacterized protein n=1 Tax=Oculimacula yallundae TaxID=86028 RepID=A0ABR4CS42_9HELO